MSTKQEEMELGAAQPEVTEVDKHEFEPIQGYPMLNWRGKRPFHSTQYYPAQLKETHGPEVDGWRNKIYWGDNLQVMSHLLKEYRSSINLIYIDPPFDSKIEYKKKITVKGKSISNDQSSFEEKQYTDIWTNDEYLQFMYERIILIRELLSENGVIVLHCDWHKSHYLRAIMDEVFGSSCYQNEIIWYYYNKMQGNIKKFAANHDSLLVYSKGTEFTFNKVRELRDEPVQQIKRVWDKETQSLVNAKDENGNIIYITSTHKTADDVWRISMLQPADRVEVTGYPTQKPESLLERVIYAFSNPNDLVFDCFMGAGTAQSVALKLGRRYLGNDINVGAIQTTTKRLREESEKIVYSETFLPKIKNGLSPDHYESYEASMPVYTGFEVYNVNHYDVFRNPVEAKDLLIEAMEIQKLKDNNLYDGEKDGRMVKIMPVNRIATKADLNELISGFDYKAFERRQTEKPNQPVEKLRLICMGHEVELAATLQSEVNFKLDIEVVDILRNHSKLEFKRDSEAKVVVSKEKLVVKQFYPMNLMQKLSLMKENLDDWRELVESVMVDWNYDGAVLEPAVIDLPGKDELVSGEYDIPEDAGTIRVKITDLLSESLEVEVKYG
jgi:DNA modification methylase